VGARLIDCDVLVVGAGGAGLAAAVAAHDAGAQVKVLEKAPRDAMGGNTRFSGGLFRAPYSSTRDLMAIVGDADSPDGLEFEPYSSEQFSEDIRRTTGDRADPALAATLVDQSYEAMRWLAGLGVRFAFNRVIGTAVTRGTDIRIPAGAALIAEGEGAGLTSALLKIVEARGIEVLYGVQAIEPVYGAGGVAGVRVRGYEQADAIAAGAVVMACGGFQASAAWRTAFLGTQFTNVKVRGSRFDTGEFLLASIAGGAQSFGDWGSAHVAPVDAESEAFGELRTGHSTNRLSFPYSVMVDLDGHRFVDEGADFNLFKYVQIGRALLSRRASIAFQLFDAQTQHLLEPRYGTGQPIASDSLDGLMEAIRARHPEHRFESEACRLTLDEYNAAVQPGPFAPDRLDGKRTRGLDPDKTNWAQRLEAPPFTAYAVTPGITFTFGGVRTDVDAHVLDDAGVPIKGFYAAGEAVGGFFSGSYPGGASLSRNAVFGRIAGTAAARYARTATAVAGTSADGEGGPPERARVQGL
jgi:tricarballylate dehydrogenase